MTTTVRAEALSDMLYAEGFYTQAEEISRLAAERDRLLAIVRDVVATRVEFLNEMDYYEAMDVVADKAHAALASATGE